jgi:hypothetical protein
MILGVVVTENFINFNFTVKFNKKFWEEPNTYFPVIRYGLHIISKNLGTHKQQSDLINLLTKIKGDTQTAI